MTIAQTKKLKEFIATQQTLYVKTLNNPTNKQGGASQDYITLRKHEKKIMDHIRKNYKKDEEYRQLADSIKKYTQEGNNFKGVNWEGRLRQGTDIVGIVQYKDVDVGLAQRIDVDNDGKISYTEAFTNIVGHITREFEGTYDKQYQLKQKVIQNAVGEELSHLFKEYGAQDATSGFTNIKLKEGNSLAGIIGELNERVKDTVNEKMKNEEFSAEQVMDVMGRENKDLNLKVPNVRGEDLIDKVARMGKVISKEAKNIGTPPDAPEETVTMTITDSKAKQQYTPPMESPQQSEPPPVVMGDTTQGGDIPDTSTAGPAGGPPPTPQPPPIPPETGTGMDQPDTRGEGSSSVPVDELPTEEREDKLEMLDGENQVSSMVDSLLKKQDDERLKKSIDRLKDEIRALHLVYDDNIPEFKSNPHTQDKNDALNSNDITKVRSHHKKMEDRVASYYSRGNLKIGVVIDVEEYLGRINLGNSDDILRRGFGNQTFERKTTRGFRDIFGSAKSIKSQFVRGGVEHARKRPLLNRLPHYKQPNTAPSQVENPPMIPDERLPFTIPRARPVLPSYIKIKTNN